MGVWGSGLFDSDEALDAVGRCAKPLEEKAQKSLKGPAGGDAAAELAAVVGLLLQLRPYAFEDEDFAPLLVKALRGQASHFAALPGDAAALLKRVADGKGKKLASTKGQRTGRLLELLGSYLDHPRDASLFATPAGARIVQQFAEGCAGVLEGILRQEDILGDELIGAGGPLGALLVVEPFKLDRARVVSWRQALSNHVKRLQMADDEEVEDLDEFVANFGAAVDLLLAKKG